MLTGENGDGKQGGNIGLHKWGDNTVQGRIRTLLCHFSMALGNYISLKCNTPKFLANFQLQKEKKNEDGWFLESFKFTTKRLRGFSLGCQQAKQWSFSKRHFSFVVLNPKTKRQSPRKTLSFNPLEGKTKYFSAPVAMRPRLWSKLKQLMLSKSKGLGRGQSVVPDQLFFLNFPAWIWVPAWSAE